MPLLDIDQKICEIIGECLEKEIGEADLESTLNDLEIDSIQFIRLVVQCETVFEMQFEDEMLLITRFANLNEFVQYVASRIEQNETPS